MPDAKDHEFFSYTSSPDSHQISTWAQRYQHAGDKQLAGDATASYFWSQLDEPWSMQPAQFNPNIADTVRQVLGEKVKLLVILRDPVQRAISGYIHHVSMGSLTPSESIFSAPGNLGLISIGFYGQHLQYWRNHFPASAMYVERRNIAHHHSQILDDISQFLGVSSYNFEHSQSVVFRGIQRIQNSEGVWLRCQDIRSMRDIQRALPITTVDNQAYLRVIHPAEIRQLQLIYQEDQQLLDKLLD